MMEYNREKTITELNKSLKTINNLYKAKCINWSGTTNDNELYSEIIAGELLKKLKIFEEIPKITRKSSYYKDKNTQLGESTRLEEIFAKRIHGLEFDELGVIIDYQVPLRDTINDKGIKAFDLLSYNKSKALLYLIELKYLNSKETLLKAILECYTYYKIVDQKKLIEDFKEKTKRNDLTIQPAVLIVTSNKNSCRAYNELKEFNKRPMLKKLSVALKIKFFSCQLNNIIQPENSC